ncbi:MAG: hypothetical protein Q7T11_02720 [Deltaproteobacteria bacterium]|nr:hypothetical protein [Deltaproteobacteria bacterium]
MTHVDPKASPRIESSKAQNSETEAPKSSEVTDKGEKESIAEKAKKLLRTHLLPGKKISFTRQGEGEGPRPLTQGTRGRFPPKNAEGWKSFFANVLQRGSIEKTVTRDAQALQDSLFRGTYREPGATEKAILVSDLHFSVNGDAVTEKFARVPIAPEQAIALEKLMPGDVMAREAVPAGEKLEFVQIVHQPAAEALRDPALLLGLLKNQSNPEVLARFEKILLEERSRRAKSPPPWVPFGGDPKPDREKKPGKPRLWTFLSYSLATLFLLIIFFALARLI